MNDYFTTCNTLLGNIKECFTNMDHSRNSALREGENIDRRLSQSATDAIKKFPKSESFLALSEIDDLTNSLDKTLDVISMNMESAGRSLEGEEHLKQEITKLYKSFVNYKTGVSCILKNQKATVLEEKNQQLIQLLEAKIAKMGIQFISKNCEPTLLEMAQGRLRISDLLTFMDISLKTIFSIVESNQEERSFEVTKLLIQNGKAEQVAPYIDSFKIKDKDKLYEIAMLSIENGETAMVAKNIQSFVQDPDKQMEVFGICLRYAKNNETMDFISESSTFCNYFKRGGVFTDDFNSVRNNFVKFQEDHFGGCPFNDALNFMLKIEGSKTDTYRNLSLLAGMMLILNSFNLPTLGPNSSIEWLNKNILPAVIKMGKPNLRLPLFSCIATLALNPSGTDNFKLLLNKPFKIEKDNWKQLTCLLSSLLICQGVDIGIFTEIGSFRYETEKKGAGFDKKENTQALVEMLLLLVNNKTLSGVEKGQVLTRIVSNKGAQSKILTNIYSVSAIINFGGETKLTDLSRSLPQISEDLFRSKCSLGSVEDFPAKYNDKIAEGRNPTAIITYAGKIESLKDKNASIYFGKFVTALLNGTFQKDRYKLENNLHLQKLSQINPGILSKWKESVCQSENLDEVMEKMSSTSQKQPLRDWMIEELMTDELEFLKSYLIGEDIRSKLDETILNQINKNQIKDDSRIYKLAKEVDAINQKIKILQGNKSVTNTNSKQELQNRMVAKLKNLKKQILKSSRPEFIDKTAEELLQVLKPLMSDDEEILWKLQFQQQCIRSITVSDQLIKMEEDKKPVETIEGKRGDLNYQLEEIENLLESGPFDHPVLLNQIKSKRAELKIKMPQEGLIVVDTDDPIDLLLCGTEIDGSCQKVDGDAEKIKGLLGYFEGENRLIAVKEPGMLGKIKARCLLSLVYDGEKFVVFMERLYPLDVDSGTAEALKKVALRKALNVGLPLISLQGDGKPYDKPLKSLGGSSPWKYSDGSGSPNPHANGVYSIHGAKYVI